MDSVRISYFRMCNSDFSQFRHNLFMLQVQDLHMCAGEEPHALLMEQNWFILVNDFMNNLIWVCTVVHTCLS